MPRELGVVQIEHDALRDPDRIGHDLLRQLGQGLVEVCLDAAAERHQPPTRREVRVSPGAVLLIVDATLDAASSALSDPAARLEAVMPILVRAARRAGALHREVHPEVTRGEAIARVLDRAEDIEMHGGETVVGEARDG